MEAIFYPIDPEKWERKPYFDYFYHQIKCKYTLNANIDITALLKRNEGKGFEVFSSIFVCNLTCGESEPRV